MFYTALPHGVRKLLVPLWIASVVIALASAMMALTASCWVYVKDPDSGHYESFGLYRSCRLDDDWPTAGNETAEGENETDTTLDRPNLVCSLVDQNIFSGEFQPLCNCVRRNIHNLQ